MKLFSITIIALLSGQIVGQENVKVADPAPAKAPEIQVKIVPVHEPSAQNGTVALVVPFKLISDRANQQYPDRKSDDALTIKRIGAKDSVGKPVKIVAVGIGSFENLDKPDGNSVLYLYLEKATAEVPAITVLTDLGSIQVNEAKIDEAVDPATLPRPQAIKLLGFQPAAPLLDGSTGSAYQLGLDLAISGSLSLTGVLSSSFLDKQALLNLGFRQNNLSFNLTTNQLFTNQLVTVGYERSKVFAIEPSMTYRGQLQGPTVLSGGIYFAQQLRLDSRISEGRNTGRGIYAASQLRLLSIGTGGFSKVNVNLGTFLFPGASANEFGTRFFEYNYDISVIFPIVKPTKTRTGYANDGYFATIGLIGGIQPANGFSQVQGLRFDILRTW